MVGPAGLEPATKAL